MKISSKGPSDKSQFIKKALGSGNTFQFNFVEPQTESEKVAEESKSVIYVKSDNSFRFNFTNDGIS